MRYLAPISGQKASLHCRKSSAGYWWGSNKLRRDYAPSANMEFA